MMKEIQVGELTLEPLFNPKSVAVFGASENTNKIGYLQVQALIDAGFDGDIYPINPKSKEIGGLTCYKDLNSVPAKVDLAILCVNLQLVEYCLEECGKFGVKSAIIFASGYSEIGDDGLEAQERLKNIAEKYGVSIVGPNCVGVVNTTNGLMGTFSPGLTNVPLSKNRDVGFVTQSGAFGVLTYLAAAQTGLTFNYFVSVGNEVNTKFSDVVEYMLHDTKTSIVSGYLEGEKNPEKLRELANHALKINKPIIILKSGRSNAGSRAAASHTGSLAGADNIYDGFFKQTGIVRAEDYEDIISFSKIFLSGKLPKGRNTAIITSSGGRGINESDRCDFYGLTIHALSETVQAEITKNIPDYASTLNPVDLTAAASVTNPELYIEPLRVLANDDDTDIIVFTEFPLHWNEDTPLLHEFIEICNSTDKLVVIIMFALEGMSTPKGLELLEDNGIPVITSDLNPIRGLAKVVDYSEAYHKRLENPTYVSKVEEIYSDIDHLLPSGQTLSESQSTNILKAYGIQSTKGSIATSKEQAVKIADEIGYPVVLKIDSQDIPHKTEVNGIKLNLEDNETVEKAFTEIMENANLHCPSAVLNGVSVQQMLPKGVEIIVGVINDPTFGPTIMLGLGGVFVEIFKDVSFRVAPITRNDAISMMEELKGYEILNGVRNQKSFDKEAIIDVLLRISKLMTDYGDKISEIDINPLIVYEDGIVAADALIITKEY